jgi:cobalt/nickel transport system permease protein
MFEETFAQGNSFVHRLDPRVKALAAFGFAMTVAVADRPAALVPAMAVAVALVLASRLPVRAVAGRLAVVNGFVLFLWLMLPFTYPGEPLFHIGPLAASRGGVEYALLITVKSNTIVLACIALLSTTHLVDMGRALSRLRVPDKLVHVLLFMLRYLGEAWREYQLLSTAMKLRSFRPRTTLHTYRSYANMMGMLLVSSYSRAEAVYGAMLCRGFSGKFHSTDDFQMTGRDILFGASMRGALLVIAFLQWPRFFA